MTPDPTPTVLLVEDSEDDVILFQRSWRKAGAPHPLHHVEDGQLALDYLSGRGEYSDRERYPLPFLVLLDLKLPQVGGLDVLRRLRESREFDRVCIVILTSSPEPTDVDRAYAYGANCYLTKALTVDTLSELLREVQRSWPEASPRSVLSVRQAEKPRSISPRFPTQTG